eukprot:2603919-Prymnesium_polylepis.1
MPYKVHGRRAPAALRTHENRNFGNGIVRVNEKYSLDRTAKYSTNYDDGFSLHAVAFCSTHGH